MEYGHIVCNIESCSIHVWYICYSTCIVKVLENIYPASGYMTPPRSLDFDLYLLRT